MNSFEVAFRERETMKIEATPPNVVTINGKVLDPGPSQRVRNHSPDGFAWGYEGSGPAQLALAILLVALPRGRAQELYQQFKREFIAPQPMDAPWSLDVDVVIWASEQF